MNTKSILFVLISIFIFSCGDSSVSDSADEFIYSHERGPGSSAGDFLQEDEFRELILEVDYMEGHEPTQESLNNLQTFLEERLYKTSVTIRQPSEIAAAGQQNYSADEVRDLEEEYRNEFSQEGTLAAYFIILDGEYSQQNVLGIAYYNTSMAFFGETIQNISGGIGQPSRRMIETTVMRHEIGHILGLVDNGTEMQEDHKDEGNGSHCDNDSCLMYYAVQTTNFFANLTEGGEIPELDAFCIADLQAAGGK
ncbi:MAG: hypothetical protein WEA56_16535 [Balneolaceae bacterium]